LDERILADVNSIPPNKLLALLQEPLPPGDFESCCELDVLDMLRKQLEQKQAAIPVPTELVTNSANLAERFASYYCEGQRKILSCALEAVSTAQREWCHVHGVSMEGEDGEEEEEGSGDECIDSDAKEEEEDENETRQSIDDRASVEGGSISTDRDIGPEMKRRKTLPHE